MKMRGWSGVSAGKLGMWIFLATDVMGFGGLLLAYAALRARAGVWPDPAERFDRPLAGALTFVLLFSGATMTAAVAAARGGSGRRSVGTLVALTALAGVIFAVGQALEFYALATTRQVGLTADHAAAVFYVITGYHGLHVLVGVAVLAFIAWKQLRPPRTGAGAQLVASGMARGAGTPAADEDGVGSAAVAAVEVASLYWQFVDVVWIVIFTVLYLLPPVTGGASR